MFKSILFITILSITIACSERPAKVEKIGRIDALIMYYSQSDGEGTYVAADRLFRELIQHPQEWYQAMSKDTISFNNFLTDLKDVVFCVDISSITEEGLESTRQQALDGLKETKVSRGFERMHNRVIQKLESIKIE